MTAPLVLTRTHRVLIGVVVGGGVLVAAIGFIGSYGAVHQLAVEKDFGRFARVFPIGIDLGIGVLLALDLLLTWLRIPFPVLRHIAWLLTAATITFNGAAAWPDPLGVAMHAVIPVLFVVTVEAARHAIGRLADITADKAMDGVRITRWLLSPVPTFKLWRRMKLWELREYEQAVGMEQDRLIYQARLQARYGRFWRRKAPVEAVLPLRLAKLGVPLTQTAPTGLVAAGIDIEWRPAPAEEIGNPRRLEPVLTVRQVAYAAKEAPNAPREEVTARIPQAAIPEEEMPECEDEVQVPAQVGPDARRGEPADESTIPEGNPQVAPEATNAPPAPPQPHAPPVDPLTERRERVMRETAAKRSAIREEWDAARATEPTLTKAAFVRATKWTTGEVNGALAPVKSTTSTT
ncbi:DUF2637 domain-containing protein [Streptomyces virginiae]|uniref:DUF2637 domain-containing protein n=1 Tax=Streptomyces virginiae TaxID=1961 RepID=UPI0036C1AF40